ALVSRPAPETKDRLFCACAGQALRRDTPWQPAPVIAEIRCLSFSRSIMLNEMFSQRRSPAPSRHGCYGSCCCSNRDFAEWLLRRLGHCRRAVHTDVVVDVVVS